jgi:hypothetical protein
MLKLVLDTSISISGTPEFTWAIRLMATGAFAALAGLLFQLEGRNRTDRLIYRDAEMRMGGTRTRKLLQRDAPEGSLWRTIHRSWATTWALVCVLVITIGIWGLAGVSPAHRPHSIDREFTRTMRVPESVGRRGSGYQSSHMIRASSPLSW